MFPHSQGFAEEHGYSPGNGITPTLLSREPLAMEEEFYGKSREEIDQDFAPGGTTERDESIDEPDELPFWSESKAQDVPVEPQGKGPEMPDLFGKPPSMSNNAPFDPDLPDF